MSGKKYTDDTRIFVINNPKAPRFSPELAKEIGLNESLAFLQIEFLLVLRGQWLECDKERVTNCDHPNGPGRGHFHRWIDLSARQLADELQYPSKDTANRIMQELLKKRALLPPLIMEADYNVRKQDTRRWVAINFAGARELKSITCKNLPDYLTPSQVDTPPSTPSQPDTGSPQPDTPPYQPDTPHIKEDKREVLEENRERETLAHTLFDTSPEPEAQTAADRPATPPAFKEARNAEPYKTRFYRELRVAFLECCGYKGRESLAKGKVDGQITTAIGQLEEDNGKTPIADLVEMVIGFGYYWQSGIWWPPGRNEAMREFPAPAPPSVTSNWVKYEDFCIKHLDGAAPQSLKQMLELRKKLFNR